MESATLEVLWRRLAFAPEAVAAPSVAGRVPSECRAALGRQMRPEEARAELGHCLEVYWKGTLALCWQTLT